MCIGIWTLEHPEYSLILCTNRDEFLTRPTQDAHFHSFDDKATAVAVSGSVLSGRDEIAGGSWFGINRAGKIALLTNITEAAKKTDTSRGHLVSSFLLSDSSGPLEGEIGKMIPQDAKLAGFNLLLLAPSSNGPTESLSFDSILVTNHGSGGLVTSRPLSHQERLCGGISNGIDGAGGNEWPKVQHVIQRFDAVSQASSEMKETELTEHLFELLAWQSPEPISERPQLRKTVHVAPIPIIVEGSPNMTNNFYGTRLSTILLIRPDGQVLFVERDIWKMQDGKPVKADPSSERTFRFQLNVIAK
ncbi:NRDE protein-domain-containing protein [Infundibulicybe gibba]|nr:NRDE protein-domain-containing protein [Infundibulicybe gibba]